MYLIRAGVQKSGGATVLPAPLPPRSLELHNKNFNYLLKQLLPEKKSPSIKVEQNNSPGTMEGVGLVGPWPHYILHPRPNQIL